MIKCAREVEVEHLHFRKCGGKVIEEITFWDEESHRHFMILNCLHCGNELFVPLRKWELFKQRLDDIVYRSRYGKAKGEQVIPVAQRNLV